MSMRIVVPTRIIELIKFAHVFHLLIFKLELESVTPLVGVRCCYETVGKEREAVTIDMMRFDVKE